MYSTVLFDCIPSLIAGRLTNGDQSQRVAASLAISDSVILLTDSYDDEILRQA